MAAALGGLGLLQGRVRLAAAAAATSSLGRPGRRAPVPRAAAAAAAALLSAGRSYGSEAKEEEELRVRYLDDEHKGNERKAAVAGAALCRCPGSGSARAACPGWPLVAAAALCRGGEEVGGLPRGEGREGKGAERRLLLVLLLVGTSARGFVAGCWELPAWQLQRWGGFGLSWPCLFQSTSGYVLRVPGEPL